NDDPLSSPDPTSPPSSMLSHQDSDFRRTLLHSAPLSVGCAAVPTISRRRCAESAAEAAVEVGDAVSPCVQLPERNSMAMPPLVALPCKPGAVEEAYRWSAGPIHNRPRWSAGPGRSERARTEDHGSLSGKTWKVVSGNCSCRIGSQARRLSAIHRSDR